MAAGVEGQESTGYGEMEYSGSQFSGGRRHGRLIWEFQDWWGFGIILPGRVFRQVSINKSYTHRAGSLTP